MRVREDERLDAPPSLAPQVGTHHRFPDVEARIERSCRIDHPHPAARRADGKAISLADVEGGHGQAAVGGSRTRREDERAEPERCRGRARPEPGRRDEQEQARQEKSDRPCGRGRMAHVESGREPYDLARSQQRVRADPRDVSDARGEDGGSGRSGHDREAGEQHGAGERHRGQVQHERGDGQAVEVDEQQRRERELGGDRGGDGLLQPPFHRRQPGGHDRRQQQQAERGRERELEADVADPGRVIEEQEDGGEAEQVRQVRVQVQRAAGEHHDGHDGRAHHGHVAADEHRVEDDRRRREERPGRRGRVEAPDEPEHDAGHERHLRAREREDVVRARDPEGLGSVRLDAGAVADRHRTHESLLGTRQHVREDRFARPLARAGGRAADEVYAAASRPRHEAAALHVAERVDAVAPRLGRGVVCARGPEAARDAEDGPGLDAISLDQAHAARRLVGRHAADVETNPAHRRERPTAQLEAVDVEEDLQPVAERAAVGGGDAAEKNRRVVVFMGHDPPPHRGRVVAGRFRGRGAGGEGEGRRPEGKGPERARPRLPREQQQQGGEAGQDPGGRQGRLGPRLRAHRNGDREKEQRARLGHPRRIGRAAAAAARLRSLRELSHSTAPETSRVRICQHATRRRSPSPGWRARLGVPAARMGSERDPPSDAAFLRLRRQCSARGAEPSCSALPSARRSPSRRLPTSRASEASSPVCLLRSGRRDPRARAPLRPTPTWRKRWRLPRNAGISWSRRSRHARQRPASTFR